MGMYIDQMSGEYIARTYLLKNPIELFRELQRLVQVKKPFV